MRILFVIFLSIFISQKLLADLFCSATLYGGGEEESWSQYFSYEKELEAACHESSTELGPFRLIKNFEGQWVIKIVKISSRQNGPARVISSIRFSEEERTIFEPVVIYSENFSLSMFCEIQGPKRSPKNEEINKDKKASKMHFLRRFFGASRHEE